MLSDADEGAASCASGARIGQLSGKSAIDADGMDESFASLRMNEMKGAKTIEAKEAVRE